MQSESLVNLAPALVAALNEMPHAVKEVSGQVRGKKDYKYADLKGVIDTARPVLAKHGLAMHQQSLPSMLSNTVCVQTTILHTSGEWVSDGGLTLPCPNDPQGAGGSVTYARRYGACAMLGMATEDDDAASATHEVRQAGAAKATGLSRGQHRGKPLSDVPSDYLEWLTGQGDHPDQAIAVVELGRRASA